MRFSGSQLATAIYTGNNTIDNDEEGEGEDDDDGS